MFVIDLVKLFGYPHTLASLPLS